MSSAQSIVILEDKTSNEGFNKLVISYLKDEYDLCFTENIENTIKNIPKIKPVLLIIDFDKTEKRLFEILNFVKKCSNFKAVPILFLAKKSNLNKLTQFDVEDFISKPFNEFEVLFRIKSIIKKQYQKLEIENKNDELKEFLKEKEKLNQMLTARDLALNKSAAVSIINKKGVIIFINDKFCSSSKFSKHELIGKEFDSLLCKTHNKFEYKNIWRTIYRGEIWRGEICSVNKSGGIIWSDTSISPIYNEQGKIIKFFTVHFDVTDRKNFEKELNEKNVSVTKSISYASRIQKALLPTENFLNEVLKDSFIVYKPRDIVSGDFYWVKQIGSFVVVAVADCTGHGVPGAFMSMLGVSFLNEIVTFRNSKNPSQILNELRLMVKKSLHQSDAVSDIDDGMDIAIFSIEKNTHKLNFSGALNPIYIVRNKSLPEPEDTNITKFEGTDANLFIVDGDEMPIGVYYKENLFKTVQIDLFDNDIIYAFSDGYCDQLGGQNYEKYSTKRFRNILLKNCNLPLSEQKTIIENEFNQWVSPKKWKQIDDILIMGLKI